MTEGEVTLPRRRSPRASPDGAPFPTPADLHRAAALHAGDLREVLHPGEHAPVPAALQNHAERRGLQHEGKRAAVTPPCRPAGPPKRARGRAKEATPGSPPRIRGARSGGEPPRHAGCSFAPRRCPPTLAWPAAQGHGPCRASRRRLPCRSIPCAGRLARQPPPASFFFFPLKNIFFF